MYAVYCELSARALIWRCTPKRSDPGCSRQDAAKSSTCAVERERERTGSQCEQHLSVNHRSSRSSMSRCGMRCSLWCCCELKVLDSIVPQLLQDRRMPSRIHVIRGIVCRTRTLGEAEILGPLLLQPNRPATDRSSRHSDRVP